VRHIIVLSSLRPLSSDSIPNNLQKIIYRTSYMGTFPQGEFAMDMNYSDEIYRRRVWLRLIGLCDYFDKLRPTDPARNGILRQIKALNVEYVGGPRLRNH
jgi:hypothetical protein